MASNLSLLGAFLFLVVGVILQALLNRLVYPGLSDYHERAKAKGRQTVSPLRAFLLMRVVNFILLPLIGLFVGGAIFSQ